MTTTITTITTITTDGVAVLAQARRAMQLAWAVVESATTLDASNAAFARYWEAQAFYVRAVKLFPDAWGR
jgi:hypothetical protein